MPKTFVPNIFSLDELERAILHKIMDVHRLEAQLTLPKARPPQEGSFFERAVEFLEPNERELKNQRCFAMLEAELSILEAWLNQLPKANTEEEELNYANWRLLLVVSKRYHSVMQENHNAHALYRKNLAINALKLSRIFER